MDCNVPRPKPHREYLEVLSRIVYADGQQYRNVEDLRAAIQKNEELISQQFIQNLLQFMPARCLSVVKSDRDKITYKMLLVSL